MDLGHDVDALPPGPARVAECQAWASHYWKALEVRGGNLLNTNLAHKLESALSAGVWISTEYSGVGGPEYALHQIVMARQQGSRPPDFDIGVLRAGDIKAECRSLLLQGVSEEMKPGCVFGNILDRC